MLNLPSPCECHPCLHTFQCVSWTYGTCFPQSHPRIGQDTSSVKLFCYKLGTAQHIHPTGTTTSHDIGPVFCMQPPLYRAEPQDCSAVLVRSTRIGQKKLDGGFQRVEKKTKHSRYIDTRIVSTKFCFFNIACAKRFQLSMHKNIVQKPLPEKYSWSPIYILLY